MSDATHVFDLADLNALADDGQWPVCPAIGWLLGRGRFAEDLEDLTAGLAARLVADGAPLWRLRIATRTLHPLIAAHSAIWQRDGAARRVIPPSHGLEQRPGYVGSPLAEMEKSHRPFRRKLEDGLDDDEHAALHEVAAEGATDYFGVPMPFTSGRNAGLICVTDRAGGFTENDLRKFRALGAVLTPVLEAMNVGGIAVAIAETYIGLRTGRRVLDGRIIRGDVETIQAAIWFSDIRGWTRLNNTRPADEIVALANRYFEVVADAVESHDGEILKLIGDGVLAVFPTGGRHDDRAACRSALAAARAALAAGRTVTDPLPLRFGVGLHFGDVLYGNLGSERRLDFTVFGPAVNLAARVEQQCAALDRTLLFTEPFARRLAAPATVAARQALKGFDGEVEILTLDGA